jgi:hypothetical protein
MILDPNNKYDKQTIELIKNSGFRSSKSGFHKILISQAQRSNVRANSANKSKLIDIETGETVSTILCCAAAFESAISEFIEHHIYASGELPKELIKIRDERNALVQWKLLLKFQDSNIDLSTSKEYSNLDCLLKLRDSIAHRNSRLLKVGDFPEKLFPCIKNKTIKINNGRGVDWTDLILTNQVSDWAIKTTIAWFGLTENEWKLKC